MPQKYRHECERCGLIAELERAQRFRDEDFYEVFHELMDAQADLKDAKVRIRELARALHREYDRTWRLEHAAYALEFELALRLAELKAAGVTPLDTSVDGIAPIVEEETEGCPF